MLSLVFDERRHLCQPGCQFVAVVFIEKIGVAAVQGLPGRSDRLVELPGCFRRNWRVRKMIVHTNGAAVFGFRFLDYCLRDG